MDALYGGAAAMAATPPTRAAVPFILPPTPAPATRQRLELTVGETPKAKRPALRPDAGVPAGQQMDIADLNQAFYNLLGLFQAEQIYTTGLDETIRSHAEDLDGFNVRTKEMNGAIEEASLHQHQATVNIESTLGKMYQRISDETDTKNVHYRNTVDVEMKTLYNTITDDRNKHLVNNENKLRDEIDAFVVKVDRQYAEVSAATRNSAQHLVPPGLPDVPGIQTAVNDLREAVKQHKEQFEIVGRQMSIEENGLSVMAQKHAVMDEHVAREFERVKTHVNSSIDEIKSAIQGLISDNGATTICGIGGGRNNRVDIGFRMAGYLPAAAAATTNDHGWHGQLGRHGHGRRCSSSVGPGRTPGGRSSVETLRRENVGQRLRI